MKSNRFTGSFSRRDLLLSASALGIASTIGGMSFTPKLHADCWSPNTVRDRFWLWCHKAGAYTGDYGLIGPSRITPVEAAWFLSIPNVFMVEYNGSPTPAELDQYFVPFRSLRQVAWSVVFPGGHVPDPTQETAVLNLAFQNPNVTGVVMDDFFHTLPKGATQGQVGALSVDGLRRLRKALQRGNKRLQLSVVLYAYQVNSDQFPLMAPYLELADVVQIWPWFYGKEIEQMSETFAKVDKVAPGKKKALGTYMWNFGKSRPLPIPVLDQQYELGLRMLRSRHIDALIFAASWLCDRKLETVDRTREWIRKVGDEKL